MSDEARILIVDDDAFMQDMVRELLGDSYTLFTSDSGEECLATLQHERPNLILLDVELPGIDGYETCRRIKSADSSAIIPVIFVSAHERAEDRIKGYESGGEDYITKPFDPQELQNKVANLLRLYQEKDRLQEMADFAGRTAMTAMTSMGEMGNLLEALKQFNTCTDVNALAEAVLAGLGTYSLQGAVQLRTPEETITRNIFGEATPLEISVISHMTTLDRITQFKSQMSITYDHVSLLVKDMPLEDPDRCGRLRDHLAMLVEGAEIRAKTLVSTAALHRIASRLTDTLAEIDRAQRQSHVATSLAVNTLTDSFEKALLSVALTESQDAFLTGVVSSGINNIINAESASVDVQDKLTGIIDELKTLV